MTHDPGAKASEEMIQQQGLVTVSTRGRGLYEATGDINRWLGETGISTGLLCVFIQHTSASLTIQENADPSVQDDLEGFFRRLVRENEPWYTHTSEGPDDMPSHIKSALSDVSLSIPVSGGKMALGAWQGVFVFEHRTAPQRRRLILQLQGQ